MFDDNDEATGDDGRVAALNGSVRRRWSAAEKAAVIRETLAPWARVSDVARRWQVDPQQVYRWEGVTQRRTMHGDHLRIVAAARRHRSCLIEPGQAKNA